MGQIQYWEKHQVYKEECHISRHSMYVNSRNHRLPLYFKHLINHISWLEKLNKLLLELWKLFHYSALNHSVLSAWKHFIWFMLMLHGAAWKRCLKGYEEILGALYQVLVAKLNPEFGRYQTDLLELTTVLKLLILDDILTITSKLCLLLQPDHKDFRAIYIWHYGAKFDHTERNVRRSKPYWVWKFEEISSFNGEVKLYFHFFHLKIQVNMTRPKSRKLGKHLILAKKGTFWKKNATKTLPPHLKSPFLSVFHQNKALHNFHKRGQHSILRHIKGLD